MLVEFFWAIIWCIVLSAVPFADTSTSWNEWTTIPSMSGCAAYYNQGNMERTAVVRGYIDSSKEYKQWLNENDYIGAVAVYMNGDVGRDVHILWPDGTIDGPYLAIDVVARNHFALGIKRNRVIDVDYDTAKRMNMRGPMAVTILFDNTAILSMAYGSSNSAQTEFTTDEYKSCLMGKDGDD